MSIDLTPYLNSTYDILAFRGQQQRGEARLQQDLADENSGGEITTGLNKMVQRFLLRLLLERNTSKCRPEEGTDFMRRLRLGQIRTEDALRSAFTIAEIRIKAAFSREALDSDRTDERFDRADLVGVLIEPGYANLSIRITSQAGEGAEVVLPIPIVV